MKRYLEWLHSVCSAAMLAALACGCGAVDPAADFEGMGDVEELEAPLAAADFDAWTAWTMPVNVCFTRYTGPDFPEQVPTVTQYNSLKALAVTGLQETWSLVPGVSFVDRGNCSGNTSTFLHIELKWGPGFGGACGTGVGTQCSLGGGLADQATKDFFKRILAHEVGHALGFGHEHQRLGNEFVSCEAERVAACQRCKTATDANRSSTAADWNACAAGNPILPVPVTTPQRFVVNSPEYQVMQEMLHNNAPVPSFELLTNYDPLSVMNYCAGLNGRSGSDFHPTALDLLGMEMTYPATRTYAIGCDTGCFYAGTGVITRTTGSVTTEWTKRGGQNVRLISPVSGQESIALASATLPVDASQLTFSFKAPRGQLLTTSGSLLNSNAAHTAVLGVF